MEFVKSAWEVKGRMLERLRDGVMMCHAAPFLPLSVLLVTSEDFRRGSSGRRCSALAQADFCSFALLAKKGERVPHLAVVPGCICT